MNRLVLISLINKSWFNQLVEFLKENEDFMKLLQIVAFDEFPTGYNRNPYENNPENPSTIFETLIYGISTGGFTLAQGKKEYAKILRFIKEHDTFQNNQEFPFKIPAKKLQTYHDLFAIFNAHNIPPKTMQFEHIELIKDVKGVTANNLAVLYLLYADINDERVLPYHDEQFRDGMQKYYCLPDNYTKEDLQKLTSRWNNKKVGMMFVIQYLHYSHHLEQDQNKKEEQDAEDICMPCS
jgi:hypothetical protein